ncbi:Hypothetical protein SSCIU_00222 [Mammaliicoccus sciuri]|nr:Hypothetical protein SSCIU_00222 [Mammaliicoccus sciuri]
MVIEEFFISVIHVLLKKN